MVHGLVDCEGLSFEAVLEDVEQLNQRALNHNPEVCKVSYRLITEIFNRYKILPCGSALGFGNGPLFVSREPLETIDVKTRIAIPGIHTTASFLLRFAYPQAVNTKSILFSEISDAILRNEFDAGVLIHEGRFVYHEQGLHLLADLGKYWEERTKLPIPLGGIVVSRNLSESLQQKIARILHRSIQYGMDHPLESWEYVHSNAKELDNKVIRNHIELFVNDYTLHLGEHGQRAVMAMFGTIAPQIAGEESGLSQTNTHLSDLFLPLAN